MDRMSTYFIYKNQVLSSLLLGLAGLQSVVAQPVLGGIDPGVEQRRLQERERVERQRLERIPDVRLQAPSKVSVPDMVAAESPCFVIREIALRGELAEQFDWVLAAARGGQLDQKAGALCLGVHGVSLATQRAQNVLIGRGFVTSRVLAEPQDLSSGRLVLTLLPGRIRAIRFAAESDTNHRATLWNALPMRTGDVLNLRDVEQALENFKRVPSADADIQIEPAETPGSSDLVIRWKQAMPFRLNLTLDDAGSKSTGKTQASTTLSYDNAFTLNDLFYLTLNHDLGGAAGGSEGHTLHYSVPFGYWLLAATESQNRYHQQVAGANQTIVYSGISRNAELKLSRLVYRDQKNKTTLSVRAFQRQSRNFIDDTEVQVQHRAVGGWEAAVAQRVFMGAATLDAGAAFRQGTGAFGAMAAPEEAFGEGTSRFRLITADLNLNAPFDLAGQKLRYSGNWRAQWNHTPLTPQDRFAIGGRYTVRGFDGESSLSAERGWLLRQEVAVALGASGHELYLGVDHGEVGGPSSQFLIGRRLTGAVLGLRGGAKGWNYEVFAGRPLKKPHGFRTASTTAGFSLSLSF